MTMAALLGLCACASQDAALAVGQGTESYVLADTLLAEEDGTVCLSLSDGGAVSVGQETEGACLIQRTDARGGEVYRYTLEAESGMSRVSVTQLAEDGDGNILAAVAMADEGLSQARYSILILDCAGKARELAADSYIGGVAAGEGGAVYALLDGQTLRAIEDGGWGDTQALPIDAVQIWSGSDGSLLLSDGRYLYRFQPGSRTLTQVLYWLDFLEGEPTGVTEDGDGTLSCVLDGYTAVLTLADSPAGTEKTVLTLATDCEDAIALAVRAFNAAQEEFEIQIESYSTEDADALTARLTAGDVPDMFCFGADFAGVSPFQPDVYGARGLLADLYAFLDNDGELARASFLPNVLTAAETDGGALYVFPVSFWIDVVVGDAAAVGTEMGWTFGEMEAVLARYPEAEGAFGAHMTSSLLLQMLTAYNYDSFVNWEAGSCCFDSGEFESLLAFAASHNSSGSGTSRTEYELIQAGEQLLMYGKLGTVNAIQEYEQTFGTEDIVFIGFPTSAGIGNAICYDMSFAISSGTTYGQACWEFIRQFYLDSYDATAFPVNQAALARKLENPEDYELEAVYEFSSGFSVSLTMPSESETAAVAALIASLDRVARYDSALLDIIQDEAGAYFAGDKTVEDTAKNIQSRASLYMAEQG